MLRVIPREHAICSRKYNRKPMRNSYTARDGFNPFTSTFYSISISVILFTIFDYFFLNSNLICKCRGEIINDALTIDQLYFINLTEKNACNQNYSIEHSTKVEKPFIRGCEKLQRFKLRSLFAVFSFALNYFTITLMKKGKTMWSKY